MTKSRDDLFDAFTPEQRIQVEARAQKLTEEALTARDVLRLLVEADAYPILGNEDVPVALRMKKAALQHAETVISSPDDPPELSRWLTMLRQPDISLGGIRRGT